MNLADHRGALLLVVPPGGAPLPAPKRVEPTARYGLGINLAGLEFKQEKLPGVPWKDYFPVEADILDYYAEKGFRYVRLPFRWERLQPDLDGEFDADYLALIEASVKLVLSRGLTVTLDCHNYGARIEGVIGGHNVFPEHLADLWTRLAMIFRDMPAGMMAYDLMTQPIHACDWATAAQMTIDAIRRVDRTTTIVAQGRCWSEAGEWVEENGDLRLHDPSRRLVMSAHLFPDENSNGVDLQYKHQVDYGLSAEIMVDRSRGFVEWCKNHGYPPQISEFGVGNDDPAWNAMLDKFLAFCQAHDVTVIAWVGGRLPENYPMSLEPRADGTDAKQMTTLIGRMTLASVPEPQVDVAIRPPRYVRLNAIEQPRFLGYDFDHFALDRLTVVRYGVAGHYVTRLLQPRVEPYVVLPSTFSTPDLVPYMEKAAYAMPDGTPFDVVMTPAPPLEEKKGRAA